MKSTVIYIIMSVLFVVAGGVAGLYLGGNLSGKSEMTAEAGQAEDDHAGHDHGAEAAHPEHEDGAVHLSEQAASNAGIVVREVDEQDFAVTKHLPAFIAEPPQAEQPLISPVPGIVLSVDAELGQRANAGAVVMTILRDALPRPTLSMTEALLSPATEEYHALQTQLRRGITDLAVTEREIARLGKFAGKLAGGVPILPKQELINLGYQKEKVVQELTNLRTELKLHGLTDDQISSVENGKIIDPNLQIWKSVLMRHGVWNADADRLLTSLPEAMRTKPWVIATIGELMTQNLVSDELLDWIGKREDLGERFLAIAGLLLEGESLTAIQRLEDLQGFSAKVAVRVPATAKDWDVHSLLVKPGDHVEAGQPLLVFGNLQRVYLEARPAGKESVSLLAALDKKYPFSAVPLVPGAGPTLDGLTLRSLTGMDGERQLARIVVNNTSRTIVKEADGREFRTWSLRTGQRYMLRVTTEILKGVMVVPADAVVQSGAEYIVYTLDGDAYRPASVVVSFSDHEFAVLGEGSELFPGDPVVVEGAFQLHLAAKAGDGGAVDPHAGHNH